MLKFFRGPGLSALVFLIGSALPAGGDSQAGGGTIPQRCRTYASAFRLVTTSPGVTTTIDGTCTFDESAIQGTCISRYRDTAGQTYTSTSVTKHATKGDVVDEVQVIPPRMLALSTTTTVTGPVPSTMTATNAYDSQRRLISTTSADRNRRTTTTTYITWDRAGRPASGRTTSGSGVASPFTHTYDDRARTQTSASAGVSCTNTFDANGNPTSGVCAESTSAWTTISTGQVCR